MARPGPKPTPLAPLPTGKTRMFHGPYPDGLSHPEARYLYKDYHERLALAQFEEELLIAACREIQAAEEAQKALQAEPRILCDRHGRKYINPLATLMQRSHNAYSRLIHQLEIAIGRRLAKEQKELSRRAVTLGGKPWPV